MSITNELREYIKQSLSQLSWDKCKLSEIADHIDAEHERLCSRSRSDGYSDGFTDGFNDIESWVIDHEDAMAEHGWVRLPKDADGEYIHIGDELAGYSWPNGGAFCRAIVNEVTILAGPKDGGYKGWLMWDARDVRHHQPDTWEHIIEDACKRAVDSYPDKGGCIVMTDLVARCKALASDAE